MSVKSSTYQIALIVILIIGIILIIHSSWVLSQLNKTVGNDCSCSGVTDQDLNALKTFTIITLLSGLGIVIYAVLMLIWPATQRETQNYDRSESQRYIASRFASQNI